MALFAPINDTEPRDTYTASASQTDFTYIFYIDAEEDIQVFVNETLQTLGTDYTVSGVQNLSGGTVTFTSALAANDAVVLARDTGIDRETGFIEGGKFSADAINRELAKLVAINQDQKLLLRRALFAPVEIDVASGGFSLPLPTEGKTLVWDGASGAIRNSVVNVDDIDSAVTDAQNSADAAAVSETNASNSATAAGNSETKAKEWAENPEDTEVETGKFSALHHAAKSEGFATDAAASATEAELNQVPIGTLTWFTGLTAPDGWLVADGSAVTGLYPDLRQALLDDSSPFGNNGTDPLLPDLVTDNRFIRGAGGSLAVGSTQLDQMQRITGESKKGQTTGDLYDGFDGNGSTSGAFVKGGSSANTTSLNTTDGFFLGFDSANSPNARTSDTTDGETRPINMALLPCIKAFGAVTVDGMADLNDLNDVITQRIATQAQAEAGLNNTEVMTSLRTQQHLEANLFPEIASASFGAVGTYAYVQHKSNNIVFQPGATFSGSNLRAAGRSETDQAFGTIDPDTKRADGNSNMGIFKVAGVGSSLSGTWRVMGIMTSWTSSAKASTVCLRIA